MSRWSPAAAALAALLPSAVRGPRREAIYALWLVVRCGEDLALAPPLPERARRRRLDALSHRLSSLTVPPSLRRALAGALTALDDLSPEAAAIALQQLVAPVREGIGADAADAVLAAARTARSARSAEAPGA
jgi:hypothetical protein